MKKVMFYRPMFYMGGTEMAILSLLRKMKNYECYVGYTDDTSDENLLARYAKYAKVVKIDENFNEKMDTLILCSPYKSILEIDEKINRNKTILWFHHFGNREASIFNEDSFYNIVDEIVTVSETCKKIMLEQDYASKIKEHNIEIEVIYNIIDIDKIIEKSERDCEIEIDTNHELTLVSCSRVCYEKGFDRQFKLAKFLEKHNIDFKWYIIGGNYYKDIEDEIRKKYSDLKDNFEFLGFLDNPYNIVKHCDYLVLLSENETWGLVITEAKILGVPCIVTDFEVAYEQILDNETGVILSRYNTDSYENKIDTIVKNKTIYKEKLKDFRWANEEIMEKWDSML